MSAPSPVWLITGVSSGFGQALALRALRAKHRVIGTVRSKTKSSDAVKQIVDNGGQVVELDMTESQVSIATKVTAAEAIYGRVDYLVNNAGYSLLGALEHFTEKEIQLQYQTNVFGPLFTTQAILPGMRKRRSGLIVNVSSVGGMDSLPTCGIYGATKFALEGMSETLSKEVAEFGISVLIVEPGTFRTSFWQAVQWPEKKLSEDYKGSVVASVLDKFSTIEGTQPGDPEKGVERMFQVITGEGSAGKLCGKVLRLPLGMDAIKRIETKTAKVVADVAEARKLEEESGTAYSS